MICTHFCYHILCENNLRHISYFKCVAEIMFTVNTEKTEYSSKLHQIICSCILKKVYN